ncbi:uncharacterized protein LOC114517244 [Dendronephthya gigantea]|uniref:uncharacterized protein LOC114517244 n=1 Tax=Dendronephthya gigantea TaxID=151771 RepID=UPI0010697311|nr:uncharacterized protein LOC114517244 [Dendronephthya gigantea]
MFGNLKDRLYDVQHDLTQGLRSISTKAKTANQRLVRKAAFTIAEDVNVNSNDQCFDCNLEAGSEIIARFYKNWAEIHWKGKDIAEKAEETDKVILDSLKRCAALDRAITSFHQELSFLPEVLEKIDAATEQIENIHSQIDVFEQLVEEFEEASVRNILERRKAKETKILDRYVEHLEYEYNTLEEEFKMKKSIEDAQTKKLERQASAERQKVYEDVFLEEMQHYIQYGATEKPIAGTPPSQSLEDITLDEDTDLEQQLNDFLQNDPVQDEVGIGQENEGSEKTPQNDVEESYKEI